MLYSCEWCIHREWNEEKDEFECSMDCETDEECNQHYEDDYDM